MEAHKNNAPPRLMLAFFRWYCHPALREQIEGDLLERFAKHKEKYGATKARLLFSKEVILLFRPAIAGNLIIASFKTFTDMKKLQWLHLIVFNLVVVLCIFLPFIPGRYDKLAFVLSLMAQVTGFLGLLLVPFGILWLIQEIKKIAGNNQYMNNWRNGYYYAIATTVICTFIAVFFALALLMAIGLSAAIVALLLTAYTLYKLIPAIKNLKQTETIRFNAAPLYLLSIPLIACAARLFFIGPVSNYSREYAIKHAEKVIHAIENYYAQKGDYPHSIEYFYDLPKPSVMGIDNFVYERNGNGYNLSFVQWQHLGATREVVMYNKNDEHNVKGHFAYYPAKQPHWKYYWLD
jgi:hypothetical protein